MSQVCVVISGTCQLCWHGTGQATFNWPWAIWKYDCNPCQDLARVSITTVICHTGMMNSSHVQVKLLFLSAPPLAAGVGRGSSNGACMTLESEGEVLELRERCHSQAPGLGWRNLLWNTRSHYLQRDSFNLLTFCIVHSPFQWKTR